MYIGSEYKPSIYESYRQRKPNYPLSMHWSQRRKMLDPDRRILRQLELESSDEPTEENM